jgi:hypothetical protein
LKVPEKSESRGTLIVTPEQVENCTSIVEGQFLGEKLKKSKVFGKSHPFFVISKSSESGRFLPVYQSEVNKSLQWNRFKVPYQVLCNVDPDRPLRITFFDFRKHSAAVPIGSCDTTFARMSEGSGQRITITSEKGKPAGSFIVKEINLIQKYSFYDYIHGGIQLNLITAIDFTASNGRPYERSSLHYFSQTGDSLNEYEKCIRAVGEILCPYDFDQLFPVFGFGAKIQGQVQHCFPLTFNASAPCVQGLEGILGAYRHAIQQVELSGPTLFSHVIRWSMRLAVESFQESRTYTILLIITDGIINDMNGTIDVIVEDSKLLLSIIIIGVEKADFGSMDILDADDTPLMNRAGVKTCRDLGQFVPFRRFQGKHYSGWLQRFLTKCRASCGNRLR